ncbi:hypothetical protein PQH03_27505 [Ralstonia insidiosa]|jgi:flagellar motor component MotA|uniref:Uncharacterized protein n=1 Tax=Ralstonia insidiosa TaxID=190721 RepID=A0A192A7R6_9RALS|nr:MULTISPECIES: hypothetical protein [Ralstonia]ANJ76378.1 hypothetical protein A9Y76_27650 [Ralstonia insidiosa]MBA9869764.1 hypothetical protein [Ralstonia insidiosa]MBA9913528.1 hypothetical protein [Ralstonia insidiosa]MBA9952760.1 hypothetical protein [Ralstonia insidiosa]MBA9969135.1 hypothetical protein [Ralstonia insidiosa]
MKHRHSPLAQLLALALLATVLFTRVAIAGYVCPPEAGAIVDASAMAVSVVNCQDMDDAQPALCADHRHDGRHWADANGHAPDLGMLPAAIGLVHVLPPTPYAGPAYPKAYRPTAVPGPIYLATARLRI